MNRFILRSSVFSIVWFFSACDFSPDNLVPPQWDTSFIGPLVRSSASLDKILNIEDQFFSQEFNFCDLVGNCNVTLPFIPPIPGTDLPEDTANYSDIYNLLTLDSGTINLRIVNNLPINVKSGLLIEIANANGTALVSFNMGSDLSGNGGNVSFSEDLAGKSLTSKFFVRVKNFASDGSGSPVFIDPNQKIQFEFEVITLKVRRVSLVPGNRFSLVDTSAFVLDDGVVINSQPLTGTLNFLVENQFPAAFSVQAYFLNEAMDMVLDSLFPSGLVLPTKGDSVTVLQTEINEERLLKLKAASFIATRMDWVAVSDPPGLNQAILENTDSLKITMVAELKVRIKP
jgi:hypothetical protein